MLRIQYESLAQLCIFLWYIYILKVAFDNVYNFGRLSQPYKSSLRNVVLLMGGDGVGWGWGEVSAQKYNDPVRLPSLILHAPLSISLSLCDSYIIPECRMRGISIMVILDTSFASCNIHPSTFANSFAPSRIHPDTVLDKER